MRGRTRWPMVCATILLLGMFSLQLTTARQESQIIDEGVHLAAGLSYWKTWDFRMNPEHPPVIKYLAALPLLFTSVQLPLNTPAWHTWNEWVFGDTFVYHNTLAPQTILFLGRLPIMLLSILLGIWIFRASRELFGDWPAVFSVSLYALDPGFIAHGHYITTDLGFAAFGFWSVFRLQRWLRQPTWRNGLIFGVAFCAAGLSKFSGVAFLAAILVALVLVKFSQPNHPALRWRRGWKILLVGIPIVALLTWALYGFDIRRPTNDPRIHQLYLDRTTYLQTHDVAKLPRSQQYIINHLGNTQTGLGKFVVRASQWPIPGYAFFRGFIAVIGHSVGGQTAYLLGQYRDTGWWYYFPLTVLLKTPLPTLAALLGLTALIIIRLTHVHRARSWRTWWSTINQTWLVYLVVPTVFFGISMMSHLNLGWRHIMFIYPFIFVLAGILASDRFIRQRWLRISLPLVLGVGMVITQFATYPRELGFFNPLIGSSKNAPRYLLDSNLDWGQDLPKLQQFMSAHRLTSIPFSYYGREAAVPTYVRAAHLPTSAEQAANPVHGWVAISVGQLYQQQHGYDWLKARTPQAILGSSIYVYYWP